MNPYSTPSIFEYCSATAFLSGRMPEAGVYLVLPSFIALIPAFLIDSGVSKSGSPAVSPTTSSPASFRAFALAVRLRVTEGSMSLALLLTIPATLFPPWWFCPYPVPFEGFPLA